MSYFEEFPYINYEFPDGITRQVKNLSKKAGMIEKVKTDRANFQTHTIQDGDTVESISNYYYDTPNLHWSVMLANDMVSPYLDMPKEQRVFDEWLFQKYSTQSDSDNKTVVLSKQHTRDYIEFVGNADNNYTTIIGEVTAKPHHFIDTSKNEYTYDYVVNNSNRKDAYGRAAVMPVVSPVSIYSYEDSLNEAKRVLLVFKKAIVSDLNDELKRVLNE
jgi:hypothetical protein|tara:strand:+ start:186 stop:836 length:651 start_codon:yes stop_codon:yes gene_type:complete